MKQIILFGIILLFVSARESNDPSFSIFIVQGKQRTEVRYDEPKEINLKKKAFVIKMQWRHLEGIYTSASFGGLYFDTPKDTRFLDWDEIDTKVMAELNYNPNKRLSVHSESLHYWAYDSLNNTPHRIDKKVILTNAETITTFTVSNFFNIETQETIKAKKFAKPLYLVFFSTEGYGASKRELQRKKVILTFK
ncbi:MAG: hypothetical protein KBB37_03385 [Bacteroidia bacterium]|nr:hypothetical protein [Bacteroidia bacterium]MBP7260306.1 hypothetical protein [Bacteroidia bacterium]MBP9179668.1 hypothetical protein [Bacteroidia bacterium]MBP9723938.1 hypothetical protein [Bacteroidia bacterium]